MPGGEGGGHTGEIPFSILIPACVDAVRGRKSPLTGEPVMVVAAGIDHIPTLGSKVAHAGPQEVFRMAEVLPQLFRMSYVSALDRPTLTCLTVLKATVLLESGSELVS
jgi:hypothetical protein